jgi:hypothetical protein
MGLIGTIARFFWTGSGTAEPGTRVAELVRGELALLEEALAGAAYELHDDDVGSCRVVTDRFTVRFGWWWRERWITAAIELHQAPPGLPFEPHLEYEASQWLEAIGISQSTPRAGPRSAEPVRHEIGIVRQVVTRILSSERAVREALFYREGAMEGYNDVAVPLEDLPPGPVIDWTRRCLLESGRQTRDPRDPPPGLA